jgi:hypothetical protein
MHYITLHQGTSAEEQAIGCFCTCLPARYCNGCFGLFVWLLLFCAGVLAANDRTPSLIDDGLYMGSMMAALNNSATGWGEDHAVCTQPLLA